MVKISVQSVLLWQKMTVPEHGQKKYEQNPGGEEEDKLQGGSWRRAVDAPHRMKVHHKPTTQ
jgi:hypothetical protein